MRAAGKLLSRVAACTDGAFAIEFAAMLPVLLLLSAGLFDLGSFSYQKSALLQAAREGAQYGTLNSSDMSVVQTTATNGTGLTGVTATASLFYECVAGTHLSGTIPATCPSSTAPPKKYIVVTTTRSFKSVIGALNLGVFGSWTPPSSVTASVTVQVTGN